MLTCLTVEQTFLIRSAKESKDDKKREKEEKKRLEQEKKEQKEKERKEHDLKKRFKLQGPIEVIHKVRARVDYKGAKNELTVKQGETIDIIRITENPEGKWLGRSADGSYGYIKTVSVEIDYDTLKKQQKTALTSPSQRQVTAQDQDVYDDVGQEDDVISHVFMYVFVFALVVLPPPPGEDDDIYNDVDDPDLNVSLLKLKADPKKQKKFEKEEKEFRKKFKVASMIMTEHHSRDML
ncbi:FYN-binding protein [Acipenser ruthenus]|uniref:FYN-binding protein n=1 Tax=Acipenser ruthenus TaxID=7906 RepID=A0A662YRZ5_ACIRT|nr:FYN-binding protein [Acipenser ruthenus]